MPLTLLAATEQLALLRRREITPLELAEEHIAQIRRLNPQLNAIIDFDPNRIRAQAKSARAGSLSGLPVTVKSSIAVAGYRCEIGSTINRGSVPTQNAVVVQRLIDAGAVILGTTNCPEFLMAYETENLLHGSTRNPWNLDHTAGGSSGGESAAIAAGLSAAGLGSDSGGSVREPAHFTGICALKPTAGRIPPAVVDQLPPINLFSASGHVNGGLHATVRAEARDDAAAQNLRDVVRGFVALARLQAGRQEQLLTLLDSVQLAGDGKTVALSVTIPVDVLNLLSPATPRQQAAGF